MSKFPVASHHRALSPEAVEYAPERHRSQSPELAAPAKEYKAVCIKHIRFCQRHGVWTLLVASAVSFIWVKC